MTKLEAGLLLYLSDHDEVIPLGDSWVDGLTPYVTDPTSFHSPAVASPGYGYALNGAIAGQAYTVVANPDIMISFFDSTVLTRNASAAVSTIPSPARYGTKNTIGYLDGKTQDEVIATTPPLQPAQVSLNRVKQLELGLNIYSNDYDDHLPPANAWMDDLAPYVKNAELFHSPSVEVSNPTMYGYAFNSDAAGHSIFDFPTPSSVYGIFDSTDLVRNATDATTTLPAPGRYGGKNTIGFLDGHVVTQ